MHLTKRDVTQAQSPVRVPWATAAVSDMCRVYAVQVRCIHINGTGYWSEWSDSVYSTPQNSRGTSYNKLDPFKIILKVAAQYALSILVFPTQPPSMVLIFGELLKTSHTETKLTSLCCLR